MSDTEANTHLDDVTIKQLVWKPGASREIASRIVRQALESDGLLWPDEVRLDCVDAADKNIVGIAWRYLAKFGVIAGTGRFRRSTHPEANGRKVFQYQVASLALAKRWLVANGYPLSTPVLRQEVLL